MIFAVAVKLDGQLGVFEFNSADELSAGIDLLITHGIEVRDSTGALMIERE